MNASLIEVLIEVIEVDFAFTSIRCFACLFADLGRLGRGVIEVIEVNFLLSTKEEREAGASRHGDRPFHLDHLDHLDRVSSRSSRLARGLIEVPS